MYYNNSMKEINIVPLFNQSAPKVWDDFMRIRTTTRKITYNIETTDTDFNATMAEFKENWAKPHQNFAFAAYDNCDMIGFISGTYDIKTARIEHLYVLPQYQGQRIGKRLLNAAETAISVDANTTDLISMGTSDKFYEKYGYISETKTNHYKKSVKNSGHCQVAPVFRCMPTLINKFAKISGKQKQSFNRAELLKSRTPIFVYRDINSNITGFGICGKNPEIYASSDWARKCIEKAISTYKMQLQTKCK